MSERIEIMQPLLRTLPHSGICKSPICGTEPHMHLGCSPRPRMCEASHWVALYDTNLGSGGGKLDLLIVCDEPAIVLVEAKKKKNTESKGRVLGQLLLYYAHALDASVDSINEELIRAAKKLSRNKRLGLDAIAKMNGVEKEDVFCWVKGAKRNNAISGIVALDDWDAEEGAKRLGKPLELLRRHGFPFSAVVCSLKHPEIRVVVPAR